MTWFGRLLGLVVAFSGFAAAHLLVQSGGAQVPPLPTVSVTVPTLPVPTLPVPPPSTPAPTVPVPSVPVPSVPAPTVPVPSTPAPTVPVPVPTQPPPATPPPTRPPVRLPPTATTPPATRPAPAPRPAQPTTTTTVAAGSQPPASSSAPSPSGNYSGPSTSSSSTAARTDGVARNETVRPVARSRSFEARAHRTPRRVSVRLAFVLPKADRIFLIVRGPAPSCEIAGYIPVRGRKGVNRVFFAGRVHGRRLDPGVYLISLSPNRRLVPGAPTEYVQVVSKRRSQPLPDSARKPSCREAGALAADSTAGILLTEGLPSPRTPTVRPAPARPVGSKVNDERDEGAAGLLPDGGVLGAATGDAAEQPFVAIAVLSLVAALLIAMVALVTRFLRGSWNP